MSRLTDNDSNFGPFTFARYENVFSLTWSSGGGWDDAPRNNLQIIGFGWAVRVWLPNILNPFGDKYDNHEREYGFRLSDMGNGYDFLQVHFGPQTHNSSTTKSWCKHLPWKQWDCVRHSLYAPSGEHFYTEEKGKWKEFWAKKDECPKTHFGFQDYDEELIIATCNIEEREWHKGEGWFKWLKHLSKPKIRRSISIDFDYEVGPEKGSWKGGTIGTGQDMLPGESVEDAFKRFCGKNHERKGRVYRLRYIGPCSPPEPHEIRVARNRGWKQCDYPHAAAKDLWYHPDCPLCDDGHYINTEEMLEFIKSKIESHNSQVVDSKTS